MKKKTRCTLVNRSHAHFDGKNNLYSFTASTVEK